MSAFKDMKYYTNTMEEIVNELEELHKKVESDPILIRGLEVKLNFIKRILEELKKEVNSHYIEEGHNNYYNTNNNNTNHTSHTSHHNSNNLGTRYGGSKRKSNKKSKKQSKKVKSKKMKK